MGMFDKLIVDMPLPLSDGQRLPVKPDWQTKDLRRNLDTYRITSDGHLWLLSYDDLDQEDTVELDPEAFNQMERVYYNGQLSFYDVLNERGWIEYLATFANGQITKIKLKVYRTT